MTTLKELAAAAEAAHDTWVAAYDAEDAEAADAAWEEYEAASDVLLRMLLLDMRS